MRAFGHTLRGGSPVSGHTKRMKRIFTAIGIATLAVAMAAPLALADQELVGTAGNDTITGAAGKDRINGLGGDDRLNGRAGRDQIRGGAGADVIVGGKGNDVLMGEAGDDVIRGGAGVDEIGGGYGKDRIFGGAGNDIIRAEYGGADYIDCGDGAHDVAFVDASDTVTGCEKVDVQS